MERQKLINAGETILNFLDTDEVNSTTVAMLLWGLAEHVDIMSQSSGEALPRWVLAVIESMDAPDGEMNIEMLKASL